MALNPYEYGHIIPWYAQFLDVSGLPLANGHIEIFVNGTSNRYISYQNFDGSENPFEIPLTAGGRCVAIGSVRNRYDVYVYNKFGGLEYSRLNVGIGDSDAVNLEFTSHDGSIIITRNNNVVDLVVRQDPSTHGTVTADGTDEYGQIQFDTVVDGDVTVRYGKIVLDANQLYHITLEMAFSTTVTGRDYYECMVEDSNGGQHKFIVDESMTTQFKELSWDITPEHSWIELNATLPEGVSLVGCTTYVHRVNPLVGGSGGGGVTEIVTDSTLTGEGTVSAPLGIATNILQNIGSKLSSVSVDGTTITGDGTPGNPLVATAAAQVQSDWNQTNTQAVDYIKNKPQNLVQDASYVHTDNNFTNADKSKLDGIAAGAEVNVQADWNQSDNTADDYIKNKPTIPAAQVQSDWTQSNSTAVDYIKNKPNLATVATSGSYNDLSNKPTIPAAQVNSDWNATSGVSMILNKPNLATVATSGSYNDLTDKPTIPTIPVTDVQVNNTSVVVNGVANVDLTPYAQTSSLATVATSGSYNDLSNKPDLSVFARSADLATVATTGDYDDLTNKPSIPAAQVNSDWNASSGVAQILNKPSLATVATSGSYNDLSDKPTIPSAQVNSDWNATSGVAEILNKPTNLVQDASYVHTDNNFTTAEKTKLSGIEAGAEVNVQPNWSESDSSADAYIKNKPALTPLIAGSNITLTESVNGVTISASSTVQVQSNWNETVTTAPSYIQNKPNLATVATSGSYNDLSDKPTVPAAQVNSDWNAVSGVAQILNKPSLATVATSGSYNDLSDKPTVPLAQVNSDWNASSGVAEILNKPEEYTLVAGTGITIVKDDINKTITISLT